MLRLGRVTLEVLKPSLAERAASPDLDEAEAVRVAEDVDRLAGMLAR
jgi:hypothetical protein